jgi:hypothetical protein
MKRRFRAVAIGLLVALAAALVVGIFLLHGWGGRMEVLLLVFGDRVWVTLDAGRARILVLLLIPGVFLGAALALYARRSKRAC